MKVILGILFRLNTDLQLFEEISFLMILTLSDRLEYPIFLLDIYLVESMSSAFCTFLEIKGHRITLWLRSVFIISKVIYRLFQITICIFIFEKTVNMVRFGYRNFEQIFIKLRKRSLFIILV